MSEVFKTHEPEEGLKSIGPFEVHRLTINGYRIPYMEGQIVKRPEGDMWYFSLENSCSLEVPLMYGHGVAWMIANAMAYAAGYSCFGEGSQMQNQFRRRMLRLSGVPDIEAMEPEGIES